MNYAFEVTVDDVVNVMVGMGYGANWERAEQIYSKLNLADVANAALYADDLDDQTAYAYEEIEKQIKGVL